MTEPQKKIVESAEQSRLHRVRIEAWQNDSLDGFASCELVYDREGRLLGVDFATEPRRRRSH